MILCRVVESSCLPMHNIVPHISWHDLPGRRTTKRYTDFPSMVIFQLLLRKFWIQTWFNIVNNIFAFSHWNTHQVFMIKERCWFSQINFFVEYFPHRIDIVSFQPIGQRKLILFHGVRISVPNWKLCPNRISIGFSRIAFLHNSLAKG